MTPTPIIRTFPDTGKNAVETAMVDRRAWLGSVILIVISRKSEYRRRGANARGVFDNKYLSIDVFNGIKSAVGSRSLGESQPPQLADPLALHPKTQRGGLRAASFGRKGGQF